MASQFLKQSNKSASDAQTDVALVVVAGVDGGDYIANTGHCGFAYKNTAKDLKRIVLKSFSSSTTLPSYNSDQKQQEWFDEV